MSEVHIEIWDGRTEDIPKIAELLTQLGYPTDVEHLTPRVQRFLTQRSLRHYDMIVARIEGVIVGKIVVGLIDTELVYDPVAGIFELVVDAAHRNQRIGEQLIAAAKDWSLAHGVDALHVRTNVIREDAHRFYERHGFELQKQQRVYVKNLRTGSS